MKLSLLAFFILLNVSAGLAQNISADTLQFNTRASRSINQWAVFPKGANNKYPYGFIYVDEMAGFTFQLTGNFSINPNGTYAVDTAMRAKLRVSMYKVRLGPNTRLIAIVPKTHYADLGISGDPDWVKIYNNYTDTLAHNVALGKHLNTMNDCDYALTYLLKTYKVKPNAVGLEFELAYAYNVLNRFDDAANVLIPAIKNNDKDIFLYKELGYSYLGKSDLDKAISTYKQGIAACGDTHPTEKAEMAINLGRSYHFQKNDEQYKEWLTKAKQWAPVNSNEYKQLVQMGF